MDRRLVHLLEHYVQTENDRGVADCLTDAVMKFCSDEIDQAVGRNLLTLRSLNLSSSSSHNEFCFYEDEPEVTSNVVVQRRLRSVAAGVANGHAFKQFRTTILSNCVTLVENLWRTNASRMQLANLRPLQLAFGSPGNSNHNAVDANKKSTHYALDEEEEEASERPLSSPMSLDQSVRMVVGSELESMVELIISEGIALRDRQSNIHRLLTISPSVLAKSPALVETLLSHFHAILKQPTLFPDAMCLLGRLLGSRSEELWRRVAVSISRIAPSVLHNHQVDGASKVRFVDFFLQMFTLGPKMWRRFTTPAVSSILLSFMDLLGSEFGGLSKTHTTGRFISTLAHLGPGAEWMAVWLHNFNFRLLLRDKLVELLHDILESLNELKELSASRSLLIDLSFQASILLHSIKYPELLRRLDVKQLGKFLSSIATIFSTGKESSSSKSSSSTSSSLSKSIMRLILEVSMTHSGANYLISHPVVDLLSSSSYGLKLLGNILLHSSTLPPPSTPVFNSLISLINKHLHSGGARYSISITSTIPSNRKPSLALSHPPINHGRFTSNSDHSRALELLGVMLQSYPLDLLHIHGLAFHYIASHPTQFDVSNLHHSRLLFVGGFLLPKNAGRTQLRAWRKQSSKWMIPAYLTPPRRGVERLGLSYIPHSMELLSNDDKRFALNTLLEFLNPSNSSNNVNRSPYGGLNFLHHPHQNGLFLTHSTLLMIAQPGLVVDLIKSFDFHAYFEERLAELGVTALVEFLRRLTYLACNLDTMLELKKRANLSARLNQLLQRHCYSQEGELVVDELGTQVVHLLSALNILGGEGERRVHPITEGLSAQKVGHLLENMPRSLFVRSAKKLSEKRRSIKRVKWGMGTKAVERDDSFANDFLGDTVNHFRSSSPPTFSYSSSSSSSEEEEEKEKHFDQKSTHKDNDSSSDSDWGDEPSKQASENVSRDWLRLMSTDQGATRRPSKWMDDAQQRLMLRLFNRNTKSEGMKACSAIDLLKEYLGTLEKQGHATNGKTAKLNSRMTPSHAEWLAPLLDLAVYGLGLAPSRQAARKKCAELRFLSPSSSKANDNAHSSFCPPDWFLGALFLSTNLDAKATNSVADKLLQLKAKSLTTIWPAAALCSVNTSGQGGGAQLFNDTISTVVFPKVVEILDQPSWRWLRDWLTAVELPLLHLLLLYSNQMYFGVLNMAQIEEYLVTGVVGGADFQAAHFLAFILHIGQNPKQGRLLVHLSAEARFEEFLRPTAQMLEVVGGFRFINYVSLFQQERGGGEYYDEE